MKPYLDPRIQEELTRIGGVVPSGKYAGQPRVKIEWTADIEQFKCGKMRPQYVEFGIGKVIKKGWFVSPALNAELVDWFNREAPKYPNPANPLKYSQFFVNAPKLEYKAVSNADSPIEVVAPKDWIYITDIEEYQPKKLEYYIVRQWVGANQLHDSPSTWEKMRYGDVFVPELGQKAYVDILGEYPKDGLYLIELQHIYEQKDDGSVRAIEPTFDLVVPFVQKLVRERDSQTKYQRQSEVSAQREFEQDVENHEKQEQERWDKVAEIMDDMSPAFGGKLWTPTS